MWKEETVVWYKVLSQHLLTETGNYENPQSPGRDLNPGFSEYEAGVLTTRPWRSFIFSLAIMSVLLHKLVTFLIMFACFVSDVGLQCSKWEFRNVGILLKNETRIYRQWYRYVFLEKRSAGMKFRNKNKFRYGIPAYRPTGPFRALVICFTRESFFRAFIFHRVLTNYPAWARQNSHRLTEISAVEWASFIIITTPARAFPLRAPQPPQFAGPRLEGGGGN
jgi:hypothetical protein